MTDVNARLADLGLSLPQPPQPVAAYVPWTQAGELVFISGQIPLRDGELLATGLVPRDVDLDTARHAARQCVLNGLAVLGDALGGDWSRLRRVLRVGVFVACTPDFTDQPKVGNGASELLAEVLGDAGRHARAAVGCAALPLNAPVEVEFLAQVAT